MVGISSVAPAEDEKWSIVYINMVTLILFLIEIAFFGIMSALFEYHWRNDGIDKKTAIIVRVWYYIVSAICLGIMVVAL